MEGGTGRRAGSESGKGSKPIKDALLLWAAGAQCSWGFSVGHTSELAPAHPKGKGMVNLSTIARGLFLERGSLELPGTSGTPPVLMSRCWWPETPLKAESQVCVVASLVLVSLAMVNARGDMSRTLTT